MFHTEKSENALAIFCMALIFIQLYYNCIFLLKLQRSKITAVLSILFQNTLISTLLLEIQSVQFLLLYYY